MSPQGSIFEGKTREEAVDKGLRELRMDRADVYVEVVEEGSSGFLGFGGRPYRVRLIPRVRRGERPPRPERVARGGAARGARAEGPRTDDKRRESGRGERRGGAVRRDRPEPGAREGERAASAPQGAREADRGAREADRGDRGGRRRRGGRGRGGPREGAHAEPATGRDVGNNRHQRAEPLGEEQPRPETPAQEPRRQERDRHEPPRREPREHRGLEQGGRERDHEGSGDAASGPPDPALAEQARAIAADLFGRMGFDAKVAADAAGEVVNVKVEVGSDEDLLIGKKGEVRQALQQLLNRMLNKGDGTRYHLHLEINDFWERRETELAEMARQLASEASESGREMLTEYLNAQERRVVHVALREDTRVKTYAIGDGLIKKVAVAPADSAGPSPDE